MNHRSSCIALSQSKHTCNKLLKAPRERVPKGTELREANQSVRNLRKPDCTCEDQNWKLFKNICNVSMGRTQTPLLGLLLSWKQGSAMGSSKRSLCFGFAKHDDQTWYSAFSYHEPGSHRYLNSILLNRKGYGQWTAPLISPTQPCLDGKSKNQFKRTQAKCFIHVDLLL